VQSFAKETDETLQGSLPITQLAAMFLAVDLQHSSLADACSQAFSQSLFLSFAQARRRVYIE
jgi:hypothetical protein